MITRKIKQFISKSKVLSSLIRLIYFTLKRRKFNSKDYWEERYVSGGNSGTGSYGRLAKFKAEIINDFVKNNKVETAIEFGCGDGNQVSLLKIPKYIGLDVSKKSIELCEKLFMPDEYKSFFLYDPKYFIDRLNTFKADLTLSLDVIYHLTENNVFEKYMHHLFSSSERYVIVYSSNTNKQEMVQAQHVRHRKFSDWIEKNAPNWKLLKKIDNTYPLHSNAQEESFADFYIYKKVG